MLITFIVTVAVLAVLYILVNIFCKKAVRPTYDFSTNAPKSYKIAGHIIFGISFFVNVLEIILYFFWNDATGLWIIYAFSLVFALLALLLLYAVVFTYEAIKDDEVYIRGFFKTKKIKICDIRSNNIGAFAISFYDKNNKLLFMLDKFTLGVNDFIYLLNDRKHNEVNEDFQEDTSAEEKTILAKIGREYRESYKERRKKFLIASSTGGIAVIAAFVLLFFLIGTKTYMMIFIGIVSAVAVLLFINVDLSLMKKDLSLSDVSLGNKYKFTNKKVKGASKHKFIQHFILCITALFLGAMFMLPLIGGLGNIPNYDEYKPITGKIEYAREQTGKYNYIAVALYDIPTEYRLSSIYLREFDYSFFDEVKKGDTVTIYIDDSKDNEITSNRFGRKLYNEFYYLATEDKEYFTQENYIKSHEHSDKVVLTLVGIGTAIMVASTVGMIVSCVVYKKRKKQEDIVIYK